jgi:hypothetical protein
MSDQEIIPEVAQEVSDVPTEETPEIETEATEAEAPEEVEETEATDSEEEGGEDEGEDEEPEEIELKVGGDVLKVPKGAMPEEIRDQVQKFVDSAESSYTRKFQEVAESRKALEARQQSIERLASLNDTQQDLYARGTTLKSEIARLQAVDLNAMWQSNPDEARRVSDRLAQRQAQFQQTVNELSQTESQFNQAREQQIVQQREAGRAVIQKAVPDFKPEPVIDYVVKAYADLGQPMSKEEAQANWSLNPGYAVIARKAMLYDQQQAKAKTIGTKPKPAEVKAPVTAPKGRGAAKSAALNLSDPAQMQRFLNG